MQITLKLLFIGVGRNGSFVAKKISTILLIGFEIRFEAVGHGQLDCRAGQSRHSDEEEAYPDSYGTSFHS